MIEPGTLGLLSYSHALLILAKSLSSKVNWWTKKNGVKYPSINTCQDSSVGKAWDCKHKKWAMVVREKIHFEAKINKEHSYLKNSTVQLYFILVGADLPWIFFSVRKDGSDILMQQLPTACHKTEYQSHPSMYWKHSNVTRISLNYYKLQLCSQKNLHYK